MEFLYGGDVVRIMILKCIPLTQKNYINVLIIYNLLKL